MSKYTSPRTSYKMVGDHIETDMSVQEHVTGTDLGGILGVSAFNTPFQRFCRLSGVCTEDISGKTSVEIGKALEEKIIRYAADEYSEVGEFIPAEEVFEARTGAHENWASDFDDELFAGHLDGLVYTPDGEMHVLEVKTTSNYESWSEGIPPYYCLQVALYNHFYARSDTVFILLGLVKDLSLADVEKWVPSGENVALFRMSQDDPKYEEYFGEKFEVTLQKVRDWYAETVQKGVSPPMDPSSRGDVSMWDYLSAVASDTDTVFTSIEKLESVEKRLTVAEDNISNLRTERDALRTNLKAYMSSHNINKLTARSGDNVAVLSKSIRKSISSSLLAKAGIDPAPYTTETVVETFSFKPVKKYE